MAAISSSGSARRSLSSELTRDLLSYVYGSAGHSWRNAEEGLSVYGFVTEGPATLVRLGATHFVCTLEKGMYFACPGGCEVRGGAGILSLAPDGPAGVHRALFALGGPVAAGPGRLPYIDGCTDTLLLSPPRRGAPCLNHLHFPPAVKQTRHTHPSGRTGVVIAGEGVCVVDGAGGGEQRRVPLRPGTAFVIPTDLPHAFETEGSELDVIAFHPDSDFGPAPEDHPMINRTMVDGVSASRLDDIRTADCVTAHEGVGLRVDAQAPQPSATAFARAASLRADAACPDESARFSGRRDHVGLRARLGDAGGTALVVVHGRAGSLRPAVAAAFPELARNQHRLAAACRRKGIPVIHVRPSYCEDEEIGAGNAPIVQSGGHWAATCRDFFPHLQKDLGCRAPPEAERTEGDTQVRKSTWDGFLGTELAEVLTPRDGAPRRHLLLCGVNTSVCVQATALGGFNRGFAISVVEDCCGDVSHKRHADALHLNGNYWYRVVSSADVLRAIGVDAHAAWLDEAPTFWGREVGDLPG